MTTHRATKIVATLGPATSEPEVLERILAAGVNVVRMNFSHGTAEEHTARVALVRRLAAGLGRDVGILADLQGPKIRIGKFAQGRIELREGDEFVFDIECTLGDQGRVGLDYPELIEDVHAGDILLLDDGRMKMRVEQVGAHTIHCTVLQNGFLSNRKGINRQGGGLSAPALTAPRPGD